MLRRVAEEGSNLLLGPIYEALKRFCFTIFMSELQNRPPNLISLASIMWTCSSRDLGHLYGRYNHLRLYFSYLQMRLLFVQRTIPI